MSFICTKLPHLADDSAMLSSPIANHINPPKPWGAVVVGPPSEGANQPGVYDSIPWISNGGSGVTWPVIIVCRRREDAEEINRILNPFISLWHRESISEFLERLSQNDSWRDVCAMFDHPGAVAWSVIHGHRCALYYDERHVIETLNASISDYRTAYKFSSFHNAFVCHLTRADIITDGTLEYRSKSSRTRDPLVPAPNAPQSPPSTPSRQGRRNNEYRIGETASGSPPASPLRTLSLTSVSPTSTPSRPPVGTQRSSSRAGQSSTSGRNDPHDSDMIPMPSLVLQYITLHNLPEDWVRHSRNVTDDRSVFVRHMQERNIDNRVANFLWNLYDTCNNCHCNR
ncbi:hypothetical protein ARMGADRAFT_1158103 [Armillaria gallica]|uniref:Uncharacterized protein n=1 Tax=Armillaria gallica TaxID=47427 RepID=A0A2H3E9X8_ARMGA|nr:hypothetical protein ARMGADRAFT_1158103 [Armillaria gallica]